MLELIQDPNGILLSSRLATDPRSRQQTPIAGATFIQRAEGLSKPSSGGVGRRESAEPGALVQILKDRDRLIIVTTGQSDHSKLILRSPVQRIKLDRPPDFGDRLLVSSLRFKQCTVLVITLGVAGV